MSGSRPDDEFFSWTKISIRVSPLAEEGLANLLFELGAQGLTVQEDPSSCLCLTTCFPAEPCLPSKLEMIARYLASLKDMGIDPGPSQVEVFPWKEAGETERWKDFFKSLLLGKRLVIKPTWEDYQADASEVLIEIDPGRAFGTGRHPTTAICLRFLERWVRGGERVCDLGTGSGILAIAALKLGAGSVKALEIDPEAARAALRNCRSNRVERDVEIIGESLSCLSHEIFDLLVANLTLEEMLPLLPEVPSRLDPCRGVALLSGILREEMNVLEAALWASGLLLRKLEFQGEWMGVGVKR
jgi:ribosomal protein L11 methyltransferase